MIVPDTLFTRKDLTIEQKWLYLVLLYEHSRGNHTFEVTELVRHPDIMAPKTLIERNIHQLVGRGLIQAWKDGDVWNISIIEPESEVTHE